MRVIGTAFVFLLLLLGGGCSSDPDTPLGSEFLDGGVVGSQPGEVVQDTVQVESGDLSFLVGSYLFNSETMLLGRKDQAESWPVFKVDFSKAGDDTTLEVRDATLRLVMGVTTETLSAVFRELASPLADSDTLKGISLGDTAS